MPRDEELKPKHEEWKSFCWPNGYLIAPEVRSVDQTAFATVATLVFDTGRSHQLCFGIPIESIIEQEDPTLPHFTVRGLVYELHPVILQQDPSEGHVVQQIEQQESIPLREWMNWNIDEDRPMFLLREPAIGVEEYIATLSSGDVSLGIRSFQEYALERASSLMVTPQDEEQHPMEIMPHPSRRKSIPIQREQRHEATRAVVERANLWLAQFLAFTPQRQENILKHLTEKQRNALIIVFQLDTETPRFMPIGQAAKIADIPYDTFKHHVGSGMASALEQHSRSSSIFFDLPYADEIFKLTWDEFVILARSAGIQDSYARIAYDAKQAPMSQLAKEYDTSGHTIKKRIEKTVDAIRSLIEQEQITAEGLYTHIEQHSELPAIEEVVTYIKRLEGELPDAIEILLQQPIEVRKQALRMIPITHRFAIAERYNLLKRNDEGTHVVDYKTIMRLYPDFTNIQLKGLVSEGVKELTLVLNGEPLPHPPSANLLYELGNDIRADELTIDQFTWLCQQATISEDDIQVYIWRSQVGNDNPYPKSIATTTEHFGLQDGEAQYRIAEARKRIIRYVADNNISMEMFT